MRTARWALASLLALAGAARADIVVLKDGRSIEGAKVRKDGENYVLKFDHGEIPVPAALVKDAFIETDGVFEPQNDDERAKAAQGLVPYKGGWVKKEARDADLKKKAEARKKRIEELKAHREWRNRWKTESPDFAFEHNIPPDVTQYYLDLMQATYKAFVKDWGLQKPPKIGKLKVCFYADYEDLVQIGGAGRGALAYYRFVPPLELNFFYDRYNPVETAQIMFHEECHYLQHLIDLNFGYPHCVGEALSEYFGASRWDPKEKKLTLGLVQEGRLTEVLADIQSGDVKRLEDLLTNKLGYADYSWGWTFTHMMLQTPKYAPKYRRWFMSLPSAKDIKKSPYNFGMKTVEGDEILASFKKYMGITDMAALEKEWHDYIKNTLKITTEHGYEDAGHAAYRNNQPLKATRYYKTAIEKGSKSPAVHINLAEILRGKGEVDEALELLKKGIGYDPLNMNLYVALGRTHVAKGGDESFAEARRLFGLAYDLAPDDVDLDELMALVDAGGAPKKE